jgi:uncharacterized membrane protein
MTFFWIMWSFAALVGFGVVCFFFIGLGDNSINAANFHLWLGMLAVVAVVLLGSLALAKNDHPGLAKALLMVLVTPGLFFVAMGLGAALLGGDWR